MKVTIEEQKLYDDFTASVFQRGYEKGKEDATISYQNAYNEGHVDGYSRGYDEGVKDGQKGKISELLIDTYIQGLNDVWEYIKKLGKLTIGEIYEIFGDEYDNLYCLVADYSPSEFIDAIKEYEEKDKHKCKECKWDEFRDAQSPVGTPCDSCFEGKNFSPKVARCCSILDDICPYDIKCEECEVHCSVERAKQKLKGDKE